jgi:5S rRNA maturation endonuclease (ribonuclease M5)
MKKERTKGLSCERARAFPIERALAKLGHFPTRTNEKEAWFLSPIRSETQASFKVSKKLNRWYDHGEGIGGNVIDLVCLIKNVTVKKALKIIGQDEHFFSFQQQPFLEKEREHAITILYAKPIKHLGLRKYVHERSISLTTASRFCKEVHYLFKGRNYFAIGLKNDSDGWELRNKYYKNSSSPKDSTHIKNGNTKLIITEGMFDLLSIVEYQKNLESNYDFLVLNSTAFIQKAMKILEGYSSVELYLDNDTNGKRTAKKLMACSKSCKDKSKHYSGFKDMNECLIHSNNMVVGQKVQDVFLLPQKQTCFTPGGRKEQKK